VFGKSEVPFKWWPVYRAKNYRKLLVSSITYNACSKTAQVDYARVVASKEETVSSLSDVIFVRLRHQYSKRLSSRHPLGIRRCGESIQQIIDTLIIMINGCDAAAVKVLALWTSDWRNLCCRIRLWENR
jgi:hypothetical protein